MHCILLQLSRKTYIALYVVYEHESAIGYSYVTWHVLKIKFLTSVLDKNGIIRRTDLHFLNNTGTSFSYLTQFLLEIFFFSILLYYGHVFVRYSLLGYVTWTCLTNTV